MQKSRFCAAYSIASRSTLAKTPSGNDVRAFEDKYLHVTKRNHKSSFDMTEGLCNKVKT